MKKDKTWNISFYTFGELEVVTPEKKRVAQRCRGIFKMKHCDGFWNLWDIVQEYGMFLDEIKEVAELPIGGVFEDGLVITRVL